MPSEFTHDPYFDRMAKARYKGDDIADEYQQKLAASRAAQDILRSRHPVLAEDATAPVKFVGGYHLGEGVTGQYTYPKGEGDPGKVEALLTSDPNRMATTLAHELTHSLQHLGYWKPEMRYTGKYRDNPLATLDQGSGFSRSDTQLPGEGSPRSFMNDLSKNDLMYGSTEPAAWLASQANLPRSQQDPQVQRVIAQNPIISTLFAQQNAQPNRAMPTHYKAPAEYGLVEKGLNKLFGYQPTLDTQQQIDATRSLIYQKLLREIPPQERH